MLNREHPTASGKNLSEFVAAENAYFNFFNIALGKYSSLTTLTGDEITCILRG